MLPKMAIHGLQIVSPSGGRPVAGIDDRGPGATLGGVILGNGGGPAGEIGIGIADGVVGRGGGFGDDKGGGRSGSVGAADFVTASEAGSSPGLAAAVAELVLGSDSRNSGIGCHEDFASLQARSAALKLPSAIFSRMADSEKRPVSCPFR